MTNASPPLRIRADHPALAGHFPGHPVVPGVVLLDEVLHLIAAAGGAAGSSSTRAHCQIEVVKFHHVVLPDQPLQLQLLDSTPGQCCFELWTQAQPQSPARLVMSGAIIT